jgi:anti-anti-sigma factor
VNPTTLNLPGVFVELSPGAHEIVVRISGEIDHDTGALADAIAEHVNAPRRLVLDLEHVTFCDSSGLRQVHLLVRALTARRCAVRIANPSRALTRLFEITGQPSAAMDVDEPTAIADD